MMLVYGDHSELCDPSERIGQVNGEIAAVTRIPPGLGRHARLVNALIEAGRVVQGVADAEAPADELNVFLHGLAHSVVRSYDTRFRETGEIARAPAIDLPRQVELRVPEGFAFYAVYPEAYVDAARKLRLDGPPRVIGIRSIGTTLGAVVAAALRAPPPITVRPFGDPFARQVDLPPGVMEEGAHYVIVDEGPGLSGSSFGAVADQLEQRGVPLDRIAFLSSHAGDLGPQASDSHRQRWACAQRVAAEFDARVLIDAFGPLEEFSTGHPSERRKFRAANGGAPLLLKFAGLGDIGKRKFDIGCSLHSKGLVAEPIDLVHGFLVERWLDRAQPLARDDTPIGEIAHYIAARARLPCAAPNAGASVGDLLRMAKRNISLEFDDDADRALHCWESRASDLEQRRSPIPTDNQMDRRQWLRSAHGHLIKTDALDHHCGHDLIGCQDVAWDVAGAIVEFDLGQDSESELIRSVEQSAAAQIDRELLDFYRIAYVAFRLGHARLGVKSAPQLEAVAQRYSRKLGDLLQRSGAGNRLQCLVD